MTQTKRTLPPIVAATLQSAVLSATSNLLAQALTAYNANEALVIDWVPVFQFVAWGLFNTPPNFIWQDYLEQSFPAYHAAPTTSAVDKAARSDDAALDRADPPDLVEPRLNVRNTLTKALLDQTFGSVANTFLFATFMNSIKAAMSPRPEALAGPEQSLAFLASGAAVDYSRVDWSAIFAKVRSEFFPIIKAGWRLWPAVSLVNYAFVKTIRGRNLVASLAGMGWGIYMSLFAAKR